MIKLKKEYLGQTIDFGYPIGKKFLLQEDGVNGVSYEVFNKFYPYLFETCPCKGPVCICDITKPTNGKKLN